jgi:hypothetical protein
LPSFTLPDHTPVHHQTLQAIALRHGLDSSTINRLPDTGIFNAVYHLGRPGGLGQDAILRVPRNHPNFIAHSYREAVVVPAVRAAGVRTPSLLAFDDSLELLPVPYTIYERVPGVTLEALDLEPDEAADVWREHGRNLAVVHTDVALVGELSRALTATLEPRRNSPDLREVALDFAAVPLRAVPYMLAGHRDIAALDGDDTIEARIVWRHLDLSLGMLPRGAVPGRSWAERPLPMLLEVLRFFLDPPDERWRAIGPIEHPHGTTSSASLAMSGGVAHV